jgi:hypothetical protein
MNSTRKSKRCPDDVSNPIVKCNMKSVLIKSVDLTLLTRTIGQLIRLTGLQLIRYTALS